MKDNEKLKPSEITKLLLERNDLEISGSSKVPKNRGVGNVSISIGCSSFQLK